MIIGLIYDMLFLIPFAIAVSSLLPIAGEEVSGPVFVAVSAAAAVVIAVIRHVKLREKVLIAGTAAIVLLAVILYHPRTERIDFLISHIWIAEAALSAVAAAIICYLAERYRVLKIAAALAGTAMLIGFAAFSVSLSKITVCAVFAYALIVFADTVQHRSVKEGGRGDGEHLVSVSPFIIVIVIASALLWTPKKPYDWGFVRSITESVMGSVAKINDRLSGKGWDSDTPFIGFSDRAGFGSSLTGIGYKVMDIKTSKAADPYLYLTGRVYDSFDGQNWDYTREYGEEERNLETAETVSALVGSDGEVSKALALTVDLTLEQDSYGTDQFLPSKCIPGTLKHKSGTEVSYYKLNVNSPEFAPLLESGHEPDKSEWSEALETLGISGGGFAYEDYEAYRDDVYEDYLPKTPISEKMKEYMDGVLEGASSDYEKLSRIEAMLKSFSYTESPGTLPETIKGSADFLDYLIFEKKEGYCSYFATAFVLLARAYDIPARYVQGYRTETDGKMHTEVMSVDAHAWPEAYIAGIGWLPFEPTPGMRGIFAAPAWKTPGESGGSPYKGPENIGDAAETEGDAGEHDAADEKPFDWKKIAVPVIFVVMFALLIFMADGILKKKRYARMDERLKALYLCRQCMILLKRRGLARGESETLSEYMIRVEDKVPPGFLDFGTLYEKILYSGMEVSADERMKLEENLELIRKSGKHMLHLRIANS